MRHVPHICTARLSRRDFDLIYEIGFAKELVKAMSAVIDLIALFDEREWRHKSCSD